MATKKSKTGIIVLLIALAVASYYFFVKGKRDKFGKTMTLDQSTTNNTVYGGSKVPGYISPGTLAIVDGLWTGKVAGVTYRFNGATWDMV